MQSNGKFRREIDLVEPKAAMRKFDRDMYDYPFDEQERHRTGESTFFDLATLYLAHAVIRE